jgi:hypothetical protein
MHPAVHLRIVQGADVIVDLPDWPHPIPRRGDYIFHPPSTPGGLEGIAGCVQTVTWRTHDRSDDGFTQTAHPYVEITL